MCFQLSLDLRYEGTCILVVQCSISFIFPFKPRLTSPSILKRKMVRLIRRELNSQEVNIRSPEQRSLHSKFVRVAWVISDGFRGGIAAEVAMVTQVRRCVWVIERWFLGWCSCWGCRDQVAPRSRKLNWTLMVTLTETRYKAYLASPNINPCSMLSLLLQV